MDVNGSHRRVSRLSKWITAPEGWMGAESQQLSPLTLLLVLVGPGLLAFAVMQALFGLWAGIASFLILELGVLALVRRDYARKKAAEEGRRADTPEGDARKDQETDPE
ncbi:hypothetical protein [Arthrobacter sp. ISL-30]|uniref:hypothetical protein n=1 Tax=Arthrobacter sp. ISL-30 TaxID=2819109 RepID=UPI001BE5BBA0|nr:hypothetical protein [Arthrobacter sp. ISL-30]MBT2515440.1 hypothetical protein [Arthrobacter sp. ISL-30]